MAGFLLLRPYQLQSNGLLYTDDDEDYFAHASALVFGAFPDYSQEYFDRGRDGRLKIPMGSIGTGLLASPFVFAFSLIDRVAGAPIVAQRTRESIVASWSAFGFVVATQVYFWLAVFLLYGALRRFISAKNAGLALILMLVVQGVPLYLYRRPVFSHIYEFFLQSGLVAACAYRDVLRKMKLGALWIGLLTGLIVLTRHNNIHFALLAPLLVFGLDGELSWRERAARIIQSFLAAALLGGLFKLLPMVYSSSSEPYGGVIATLKEPLGPLGLARRIFYILFGADWGFAFTAPFCLVGLGVLAAWSLKGRSFPLRNECAILALALMLNVYVIARLGTQGAWYGYRNILFSMLPVTLTPFACWLEKMEAWRGIQRKAVVFLLALLAVQPILSMLAFEGNNSNLTLHQTGQWGWANLTYQIEIWKTLLHRPGEMAVALLKGGPLYVAYLFAHVGGIEARLPAVVLEKYPVFSGLTLIKWLILSLLPALALMTATRFSPRPRAQ